MIELNKIYEGSCLDVIKTFEDKSIDCVITSPPYYKLRDYGWSEQWGLENTFQEYLEHLWSLMDEIYRVLKDTGTVWINLGDSYSNSGGSGSGEYSDTHKQFGKIIQGGTKQKPHKEKGMPNKCLLLIPHRFAIGCIDRGWVVRNDIIWAKRNCMPESVTDRFSKKHEYIFLMTKQEKYYFDLDGIKDRATTKDLRVRDRDTTKLNNTPGRTRMGGLKENNYDTKNPGTISDFWDVPTKPNSDEHYASYNDALIGKPIIAGCPKGGIILDPFCGTATTGCRAIDLQRKFIGIEGKPEYVALGNKNLLPYQISQQLF
jgi:DNA modification methylase